MKRVSIFLTVLIVLTIGASLASADSLARDALVIYSGTDAFTQLEASERQACVNWLVTGGTMTEDCRQAVMKLVAQAPDAVSSEQRQALISEASGKANSASVTLPTPAAPPEPKVIVEKKDDTGKIVAAGVLGLVAGLVIHNNVRHSKSSGSSYTPAPPRPAPNVRPAPKAAKRPPQPVKAPKPVSGPVVKRPKMK